METVRGQTQGGPHTLGDTQPVTQQAVAAEPDDGEIYIYILYEVSVVGTFFRYNIAAGSAARTGAASSEQTASGGDWEARKTLGNRWKTERKAGNSVEVVDADLCNGPGEYPGRSGDKIDECNHDN